MNEKNNKLIIDFITANIQLPIASSNSSTNVQVNNKWNKIAKEKARKIAMLKVISWCQEKAKKEKEK